MPRCSCLSSFRRLAVHVVVAAATLAVAGAARAERLLAPESPYQPSEAATPNQPYVHRDTPAAPEAILADSSHPEREASLFRFHVGPALLLQPASPGLFIALDVGRRAVGARLSASWLRAESDRGLASYTAELWVDLAHRYELHPVLGAGASLLRGGALGSSGSAGAGVLRGALEYDLPLADADARVGLNLLALVPAIESERTRPWVEGSLTIGAGF